MFCAYNKTDSISKLFVFYYAKKGAKTSFELHTTFCDTILQKIDVLNILLQNLYNS